MIKLTFCVRRRPEVDPAEFHRYWLEEHGPPVRSYAEILKIHRYVQSHRQDTPLNDLIRGSRNAEEGYDGVAELWWESPETLAAGASSPEGTIAGNALLEDERRFIDLERSALWFNEEHEIVPPGTTA